MPNLESIRHCLEKECEHCQVSGKIASCGYQIPHSEGHSQSRLAMILGSDCRYHLSLEQESQIKPPARVCEDYYPEVKP